MTEEWKDIEGYEGLYQVSNKGRVKSLTRWDVKTRSYLPSNFIMTPSDNGNGYLIVSLRKGTHRKNFYVHRLVAGAFLPRLEGLRYVNHLDYDKRNNDPSNLEWCTQRDNVLYSVDRMRKPRRYHKASNTGYKYIYFRQNKGVYRIKGKSREYSARTLDDALRIRAEVWEEVI